MSSMRRKQQRPIHLVQDEDASNAATASSNNDAPTDEASEPHSSLVEDKMANQNENDVTTEAHSAALFSATSVSLSAVHDGANDPELKPDIDSSWPQSTGDSLEMQHDADKPPPDGQQTNDIGQLHVALTSLQQQQVYQWQLLQKLYSQCFGAEKPRPETLAERNNSGTSEDSGHHSPGGSSDDSPLDLATSQKHLLSASHSNSLSSTGDSFARLGLAAASPISPASTRSSASGSGFQCDICGQAGFETEESLKEHEDNDHGEESFVDLFARSRSFPSVETRRSRSLSPGAKSDLGTYDISDDREDSDLTDDDETVLSGTNRRRQTNLQVPGFLFKSILSTSQDKGLAESATFEPLQQDSYLKALGELCKQAPRAFEQSFNGGQTGSRGLPFSSFAPFGELPQINGRHGNPGDSKEFENQLIHRPPGGNDASIPAPEFGLAAKFQAKLSDIVNGGIKKQAHGFRNKYQRRWMAIGGKFQKRHSSSDTLRGSERDEDWETMMEVTISDENAKLQKLVDKLETKQKIEDPNQCVICERMLSCKSALQMHYRTHTGERPYKCKLCLRAFTTKGNLKTHMVVHRTKPPVRMHQQCPVCQRKFSNGILLHQHIRSHSHSSKTNDPAATLILPPPVLSPQRISPLPDSVIPLPATGGIVSSTVHHPPSRGGSRHLPKPQGIFMPSSGSSFSPVPGRHGTTSMQGQIPHGFGPMPRLPFFGFPGFPGFAGFPQFPAAGGCLPGPGPEPNPYEQFLAQSRERDRRPPDVVNLFEPGPGGKVKGGEDGRRSGPIHVAQPRSSCDSSSRDCSATRNMPIVESKFQFSQPSSFSQSKMRLSEHMSAGQGKPSQQPARNVPRNPHRPENGRSSSSAEPRRSLRTMAQSLSLPKSNPFLSIISPTHDQMSAMSGRPNTTCNICLKVFACNSALEIHYRSHTKERPFKCHICERGFSTKGNMKQHLLTHKIRDGQQQPPHASFSGHNSSFSIAKKSTDKPVKHFHSPNATIVSAAGFASVPHPSEQGPNVQGGGRQFANQSLPPATATLPNFGGNGSFHSGLSLPPPHPSFFSGLPAPPAYYPTEEANRHSAISLAAFEAFMRNQLSQAAEIAHAKPSLIEESSDPILIEAANQSGHKDEPSPAERDISAPLSVDQVDESDKTASVISPNLETSQVAADSVSPDLLEIKAEPTPVEGLNQEMEPPPQGISKSKLHQSVIRSVSEMSGISSSGSHHHDNDPTQPDSTMESAISPLESIRKMWAKTEPGPAPRRAPLLAKHQCQVCYKHFSSASALQIHMRTHTGDKPFKCNVCDRAFTTKGNLKVHMGTHVFSDQSAAIQRAAADSEKSSNGGSLVSPVSSSSSDAPTRKRTRSGSIKPGAGLHAPLRATASKDSWSGKREAGPDVAANLGKHRSLTRSESDRSLGFETSKHVPKETAIPRSHDNGNPAARIRTPPLSSPAMRLPPQIQIPGLPLGFGYPGQNGSFPSFPPTSFAPPTGIPFSSSSFPALNFPGGVGSGMAALFANFMASQGGGGGLQSPGLLSPYGSGTNGFSPAGGPSLPGAHFPFPSGPSPYFPSAFMFGPGQGPDAIGATLGRGPPLPLWKTTCSVCNATCATPLELEAHLKEHMATSQKSLKSSAAGQEAQTVAINGH